MCSVINFPKGVFSMKTKRMIIAHNVELYRKSSKKQKGEILDELSMLTGLSRKYISYLLRMHGKKIKLRKRVVLEADITKLELHKRGRKKVYDKKVAAVIVYLWRVTGHISSKHLKVFIEENFSEIERMPFMRHVDEDTRQKLLSISASTIDRILRYVRERERLRCRYGGNPFGSNVKGSISVESYFDKEKGEVGHLEVDLVHHCGDSVRGEFLYTLTVTDIRTGWTELRVLRNKAMVWTERAMRDILESLPFEVKHIHCDNGSEFINSHLKRLCDEMGVRFTRSRPYRKNDAPYVESKNYSLVRRYVGWRRYDSEEELKIMEELMGVISLRFNFFMPTMKLVYYERDGKKKRAKRYEIKTPYRRLLESGKLTEKQESRLKQIKESLNFYELTLKLIRLYRQLDRVYNKKLRRLEDNEPQKINISPW